eukprot:6206042-Pleurochrysis_carterae.AAC.1
MSSALNNHHHVFRTQQSSSCLARQGERDFPYLVTCNVKAVSRRLTSQAREHRTNAPFAYSL